MDHETQERELTLASGPYRLAATIVQPDRDETGLVGAGPAVLFLHGMGSDRHGYVVRARRVAGELGATCLAVDLSGHGQSGGDLPDIAPRQHLRDALAAYDVLAAQGVDGARIGVCGASYGGFLAALLTREREVARLLVRAPTIVADRFLDRPLREREKDRSAQTASAWVDALRAYDGPTLVVESGRDEVIPDEVIAAYLATARRADHLVMPEARHALLLPEWRATFEQAVLDFFRPL